MVLFSESIFYYENHTEQNKKIYPPNMQGEIMRYLIFIFLVISVITTTGCTGENKITNVTPDQTTPINLHKTVDLSALQAKYGIYGSCSDVTRIYSEISQTDAIYKCSDPKKSMQLDNQNCFFNGLYIDCQLRYDLASLSTGICAREEAGRI